MKRVAKYLLIMALTFTGATAFAQSFRDSRSDGRMYNNRSAGVNRIEATKENYILSQLNLSPDEADRFLPVYRQYQQELVSIRRQKRRNNSSEQSNGTEQINREMQFNQQLYEVKRRYNTEFLKILSPQKVSVLYKSEKQFNDELIRQMGERRGEPD
ncbi:hypothetical protein GCM10027037_17730 [Mucilaginibacter koreensis]